MLLSNICLILITLLVSQALISLLKADALNKHTKCISNTTSIPMADVGVKASVASKYITHIGNAAGTASGSVACVYAGKLVLSRLV